MLTPAASKPQTRRAIRRALRSLDPRERGLQEARLLAWVPDLPGFLEARVVLLYMGALPEEVPTRALLELCLARGQHLLLPRADPAAKRLRLHRVVDLARDLHHGIMNIPEPLAELPECDPADVAWALVPGLAFDERGFRLGRGAGYYDRLLPALSASCPRWAIAFEEQCVPRLPTEAHDQPVHGVLTPRRAMHFRAAPRPFS